MGDGGGPLCRALGIGLAENVSSASMQQSTPGSGKAIIEVTDEQWLPEMIVDVCPSALFGQNAGLESFIKQIKDSIFVGGGVVDFHGADKGKFKGATEDSGVPQQLLTVTA